MPLLADLLEDLAGGLPGDSLQTEQTYGEPLRQQTLQSAVQVLGETKKVTAVNKHPPPADNRIFSAFFSLAACE